MTAVHDTLRQAIAGEIAASDGHPADWEDFLDVADRVLAVVLADPEVRRAFAITRRLDELENETFPDKDDGWWNGMAEITDILRAAGETT